jgi:hypothetical protein
VGSALHDDPFFKRSSHTVAQVGLKCVMHTLAGEEVDEGLWDVCFGPFRLGQTNERIPRIEDHKGRTVRKTLSPYVPGWTDVLAIHLSATGTAR